MRAPGARNAEAALSLAAWAAAGREVAVIGLGASGIAATRLLRNAGLPVYASDRDTRLEVEAAAATLRALGAEAEVGRHDLARIAASGGVVVSPGVPPDAPPVAAARGAGVPIRAEADLGLEQLAGVPYVAITGTNGKTTTTELVAHLLRQAGIDALAVGNVGTPVCDAALRRPRPAWLAVELSSFQLHDGYVHRPAVGILTNLSADHLDRYSSLDDYAADKARLFRNAEARSVWILNADDPASLALADGVPGRRIMISLRGPADGWYDRTARRLLLAGAPLLPREDVQLLGDHNVANALMASAAAEVAGCRREAIADGLRSFRALAHRLEPVGTVGGVLWINDSKATNVASTEVALAAMDRPYVLLLGGRHKGEPYTRLIPALQRGCRAVVAYGEAEPLIRADLEAAITVVGAGTTWDAVLAAARHLARPGDAVLLSPACSSYDMFDNYGQRGARFRAAAGA